MVFAASNSTIGYSDTSATWLGWNGALLDASSMTNETVTLSQTWTVWNGATGTTTTYTNANATFGVWVQAQRETEEQKAAREARQAEWAAEQKKREQERKEAEARAEALLVAALTAEQRAQKQRDGWFLVDCKSGKRYRIDRGTHGNVKELDDAGRVVATLCAQPDRVPAPDAHLAQKLMLETDEAAFLRVANRRAVA